MGSSLALSCPMVQEGVMRRSEAAFSEMTCRGTSAIVLDAGEGEVRLVRSGVVRDIPKRAARLVVVFPKRLFQRLQDELGDRWECLYLSRI